MPARSQINSPSVPKMKGVAIRTTDVQNETLRMMSMTSMAKL